MFRFEDAVAFLKGTWESNNGSYYFTLHNDGDRYQTSYYLPFYVSNGTFDIKWQTYFINGKNAFSIEVIDKDEIQLRKLGNNNDIRLYRK